MKSHSSTEIFSSLLAITLFAAVLNCLVCTEPKYSQWQMCEAQMCIVTTNRIDSKDWLTEWPMYLQIRTNLDTGEIQFRAVDYKSSRYYQKP
jgi:hypothetical protein